MIKKMQKDTASAEGPLQHCINNLPVSRLSDRNIRLTFPPRPCHSLGNTGRKTAFTEDWNE